MHEPYVIYKYTVYAYQVNNAHGECYRLSNEVGGPIAWELYDAFDPSAGIVIKLTNGDYSPFCQDPSKNRGTQSFDHYVLLSISNSNTL